LRAEANLILASSCTAIVLFLSFHNACPRQPRNIHMTDDATGWFRSVSQMTRFTRSAIFAFGSPSTSSGTAVLSFVCIRFFCAERRKTVYRGCEVPYVYF
jgi:hypothetical protein